MRRIILTSAVLVIAIFISSFIHSDKEFISSSHSSLEKLIQKKKSIDDYRSSKGANVEKLVGFPNDSILVSVVNGNFPRGYNRIFNIVRDKAGKVLMVIESPVGSTDEWLITHNLYYDDAGSLFSYVRETNFQNSKCTEGTAFEKKVNYYGNGFKLLKSTYELTDFYGKQLKKETCNFPYNFDYKLVYTYKEYAKAKKIKIGA